MYGYSWMDGIVIVAIAQEEGVGRTGTEEQYTLVSEVTESLLVPYINYLTFGIDIAAGLIIGLSAIFALISFFKILRKPIKEQTRYKETIRLSLTRGMLLALDFEIGSDILKTILIPSVRELTILAVIVGIRIVLSWSLSKEIERHSTVIEENQQMENTTSTKQNTWFQIWKLLPNLIVINNDYNYIYHFLSFFLVLSLLLSYINIEDIIFTITLVIDIIAVSVIAVSVIQTIYYLSIYNFKSILSSAKTTSISNSNIIQRNFITGLMLALEFEAANTILKMGVFTSLVIDKSSTTLSDSFINNFIIFVMVISIRIAIKQSLRRFNKWNSIEGCTQTY